MRLKYSKNLVARAPLVDADAPVYREGAPGDLRRFGPVVYVLTVPLFPAVVLRGQFAYMRKAGCDVIVVSSPGPALDTLTKDEGIRAIPVSMEREIAPLRDLVSLCRLLRVLRKTRPLITNVGSPKAGLLGGLAAWYCRVPRRIYYLHGLRLETTHGPKRKLLSIAERIACRCAHVVVCSSESLRRRAVDLGLVEETRTMVLGDGSANGVDLARFTGDREMLERARGLRGELQIPVSASVVGFVGRLTKDKGIVELVSAFLSLLSDVPDLRLLLVGDYESGDPVPDHTRNLIDTHAKIIRTGFVDRVEIYYHLMDLLALPSHREGFGAVSLEAAAAGKPVVGTRTTGVVDAVQDGVTGILVPVGDADALARAILRLVSDKALAKSIGEAGRLRVERHFQSADVCARLLSFYRELTAQAFERRHDILWGS